ncbi:hypothetical protein D9758_003580 [Tetrapyrgos nigripes]|uniref:Uncharacterized protein n=1 Tax=Tetrapyrgos nigripes TaxID=182062 RepID=A0A8H5LW56_9AGAR|nr:hypothetical protein D9758_003580 [Tetrapyrgos nigripes]
MSSEFNSRGRPFTGPPPWITQWNGSGSRSLGDWAPPRTNSVNSQASVTGSTGSSSSQSSSLPFPTSSQNSPASTQGSTPSQRNSINTPMIVGSAVGGSCGILLVLLLGLCFLRRRRRLKSFSGASSLSTLEGGGVTPYLVTPGTVHLREKDPYLLSIPSSQPQNLNDTTASGEPNRVTSPVGSLSKSLNLSDSNHHSNSNPRSSEQMSTGESDALRNQIAALQQAVVSSHDGVEDLRNAITTIMAQIQRSGSLGPHDHSVHMTRGGSSVRDVDDPPPVYGD